MSDNIDDLERAATAAHQGLWHQDGHPHNRGLGAGYANAAHTIREVFGLHADPVQRFANIHLSLRRNP